MSDKPLTDITFSTFDLHPDLLSGLEGAGFTRCTPIQAMTLPVALSGHDIIGQAKTGTGKTLGFGVPILNRVVAPGDAGFESLTRPGKPQALAVAPTRELAVRERAQQVSHRLAVLRVGEPVVLRHGRHPNGGTGARCG